MRFPCSCRREWLLPIIPVTVSVGPHVVSTDALVDSGASVSLFRQEIGDLLNLEIEGGEEILLQGLGGRVIGYVHDVNISLGKLSFVCPVVFSREMTVGVNILRRKGFFEKFRVIFDERAKEIVLDPQPSQNGSVSLTK